MHIYIYILIHILYIYIYVCVCVCVYIYIYARRPRPAAAGDRESHRRTTVEVVLDVFHACVNVGSQTGSNRQHGPLNTSMTYTDLIRIGLWVFLVVLTMV